MTREEIRQAFRQAQQEEFADVPQQPAIQASSKFRQKMARKLGLTPHPISRKKRIAIVLLVAILLILGGCTVYQTVFASSARIAYVGTYTYDRNQPEHRYLVGGYTSQQGSRGALPHYAFPTPEGFLQLCNNADNSYNHPGLFDQWYNPDTMAVINLYQEQIYNGLVYDTTVKLEPTDVDGMIVYYGCEEDRACAFWVYQDSVLTLEYWGDTSQQKLLDWIGQMDYTDHPKELDLDTVSDFYCYLDYDYNWDVYPPVPQELKYWYRLWDEVYDVIDRSTTGRARYNGEDGGDSEASNYLFETVPEGFTLTAEKAELSSNDADSGGFCLGWSNDYANSTGTRIRLQQVILSYLPNGSGHYIFSIPSTNPMEEVKVLDMDGLYGREEGYSRLVWRYGGRMMEILYYGDISKEDLIALAETVDYSQE